MQFHEQGSHEEAKEFEKLSESGVTTNVLTNNRNGQEDEDEDYSMNGKGGASGLLWKVASRNEYQDQLAPFDTDEDYSTASMLKNKGPNLTVEKLAALTGVEEIVTEIIKKAGVIDYERLVRLMKSACHLGKHSLPKEADLVNELVSNLCLVSSTGALICRSRLLHAGDTQKRLHGLRNYVIQMLERHKEYPLAKILEETNCKFDELGPIIHELSLLKEGVCTMRVFADTKFKGKLKEQHAKAVKEGWVKLGLEVQRALGESFYEEEKLGSGDAHE